MPLKRLVYHSSTIRADRQASTHAAVIADGRTMSILLLKRPTHPSMPTGTDEQGTPYAPQTQRHPVPYTAGGRSRASISMC